MFLNIDKQKKNAVAVRDSDGNVLTYGQLKETMLRIGKNILERCVTFCLCRNNAGGVAGYLGMTEAGAVPLMLDSKLDKELIRHFYDLYRPSYLWIPVDFAEGIKSRIVFSELGYCLVKTDQPPYPLHPDLQLLMTTSGSTGSPKLVRYKKGNLEANARNVAEAFSWSEYERPVCDLGIQYTMGLNVINTHLYVGATLLLTTANLMSSDFWDFVEKEKATNFTGVPFSYEILSRLHFEKMNLPALTTLAQGGGKLTAKRFREYASYAKEKNKRFIATFGTTETAARMSVLPADEAERRNGSIGKAIPEGELFLIDEGGSVQTRMEAEGELCYKGPNVTMGYAYNQEDLQKGDEWCGTFYTGDLARRDKDGFYYIVGRKSRFLKLLSYRISLDQCENLIREQLEIDCACTGNDQQMEIYITENDCEEKIIDLICNKTGLYRTLFKVIKIDSIERTSSGKIKYDRLKDKK